MRITKNFGSGVMNKNSDERIIPNGMYRHAENIRVLNSEGPNSGVVENIPGTTLLKNLTDINTNNKPFTKAETIGVGKDDFAEKVYYLVATDSDDYLLEYNKRTNTTARVLQHSTVLNLNENFHVTEIQIIRDSYSGNIYATWTDNYNPPRFINIERAKTYGIDGFIEDDISLIKKPPRYAPEITLGNSLTTNENNIEDKFLAFAYRYKYLDGEYSALSYFTNYVFDPKAFQLDFSSLENEGMVNSFNSINIKFNTGSKRVVAVDLVYKESGKNTIYKIQTFRKEEEGWGDNELKEFEFVNDKIYSVLSEKELYRLYDAVPLKAGDMTLIDNRLVLADITEGRNMIDNRGHKVDVNFSLDLVGDEIISKTLETKFKKGSLEDSYVTIDFNGVSLLANHKLIVNIRLRETNYGGIYNGNFHYVLEQDYNNLTELLANQSFVDFIETVWSAHFFNNYELEVPDNSTVYSTNGFYISPIGASQNKLRIGAPRILFQIGSTPPNPITDSTNFFYSSQTSFKLSSYSTSSSLKTNRSYEIGMLYVDEHNRATPSLVCKENTLFVPINKSINKNQIQVTVKNNPPNWADRYKFVIKQNTFGYETIYINTFYFIGAYAWVLLEGANKNKVKEGDTLIVKSDVDGVMDEVVRVKVLDVERKETGFLSTDPNSENLLSDGEAGVYMKIRPNGFSLGSTNSMALNFYGFKKTVENHKIYTDPIFGEYDELGQFTPYALSEGSKIRITIRFWRHGSDGYDVSFDETYTSGGNYATYRSWFESEVDFSGFKQLVDEQVNPVYDGTMNNPVLIPFTYNNGYGFKGNSENFWVRQPGVASDRRKMRTEVRWEVITSGENNLVILETDQKKVDNDIYFETSQTFDIVNGKHQGNIQNQTDNDDAIVLLDAYNCFVQGNGAESYKLRDTLNGNSVNIDLRPTTTTEDEYKERRLFSTFTWGGNYVDITQYNSLNEFNRFTLNIKQTDDKYGVINRVIALDNNLICFQDDRVSHFLYRKKSLFNQDGSSNVGSTEVDFGDQIPYLGLYGCQHPLTIAVNKSRVYFLDVKRSAPCRLSVNGIEEITGYYYETENTRRELMIDWFKEVFRNNRSVKAFAVYDLESDEYILYMSFKDRIIKKNTEPKPESFCLAFTEHGKGWSSFYTMKPDRMISMNDKSYGFKNGNLWKMFDDKSNPNSFFGEVFPSKLIGTFNNEPSNVKVFHSLNIEGSKPFPIKFKTNLVETTLKESEFKEIEKEWYSDFRKGEIEETNSQSVQGIGNGNIIGNTIEFNVDVNPSVSVGDKVYAGSTNNLIGTIQEISGNKIIFSGTPAGEYSNVFIFAMKNPRVEGSEIRGYYLDFDATIEGGERFELFSINSEISMSEPYETNKRQKE